MYRYMYAAPSPIVLARRESDRGISLVYSCGVRRGPPSRPRLGGGRPELHDKLEIISWRRRGSRREISLAALGGDFDDVLAHIESRVDQFIGAAVLFASHMGAAPFLK